MPAADGELLDLYRLAVEMADRVSARRATANTSFVGIQTAIAGALGFLSSQDVRPDKWLLVALSLVGLTACAIWYLLLRSYRDLNRAKFAVITEIEKALPVQLFGQEWETLKADPVKRWRGRYAELGSVERFAPAVFAVVNIITAIYLVAR